MTRTYEKLDPICYPLANRFYKLAREKGKTQSSDEVYVTREGANIIAAVRLCPLSDRLNGSQVPADKLLLRSLAVLPDYRRTGIGRQFMAYVAQQIGARECWCYPFSWLEGFYARTGFLTVTPDDAPDVIRSPFENYRRQGRDILIMVRPANGLATDA